MKGSLDALEDWAIRYGNKAKSLKIAPSLPALGGMGLLSYGIATIYLPAGLIAGGILLLFLDSRL